MVDRATIIGAMNSGTLSRMTLLAATVLISAGVAILIWALTTAGAVTSFIVPAAGQ